MYPFGGYPGNCCYGYGGFGYRGWGWILAIIIVVLLIYIIFKPTVYNRH